MAGLSPRDFDAFMRMLPDLYACRDPGRFLTRSIELMTGLVSCDNGGWGEVTVGAGKIVPSLWILRSGQPTPVVLDRIAELALEHPFAGHFAANPNRQAARLSDFPTRTRDVLRGRYPDLYSELDMEYELGAVPIRAQPNRILGFGLSRRRRDFSERDRDILTLARPHLAQAYRNSLAYAADARSDRSLLSLLQHVHGMTEREAEVAFWMAQGKTNSEIGRIVSISPRTVDKHMERVLKRLRVENRVAGALAVSGLAKRVT